MPKASIFCLTLVTLMISRITPVWADDYPALSPWLNNHVWELGSEISHITYKEPDVMKEKGTLYGVAASFTARDELMSKLFMFKIEGRGSWGEVDYENSGTIDGIDDYLLEFRGLGGYSCYVSKKMLITPYFGFGYRYLNDDMSGHTSSTGAAGYKRESNYYYSPMGIETIAELSNGLRLRLMLEFDLFWTGEQKSHLSAADSALGDLENDQDSGYGARGSLSLEMRTDRLDLSIEPFIRYWKITDSEKAAVIYGGIVVGYGIEPKNNSTEIGGRFSARF